MLPKFVICGIEHSGTTLVSDVFRQIEGLDSGFEVGILLSKTPSEFRTLDPFISNIKQGWGVTDKQLDIICNCDSFGEFYHRLRQESSIIRDDSEIFDKTPRYFSKLSHCLDKVECNFIVIFKDPRSLVFSDYKRAGNQPFNTWFENYAPGKINYLTGIYSQYIKNKRLDGKRLVMVSLEEIVLNTRETFEKIFGIVEKEFKIEYLMLKNRRYKHTREAYISSKIPFEYMDILTHKEINKITKAFSKFNEWFYQ